ncbi:MAG: Asp-tRNA(Asn)/Glu-tRNA(Gln) amidotransferase subunit GatA [Pseudomonadota bacterium]
MTEPQGFPSLKGLAHALRKREFSSVELAEQTIEHAVSINESLNCFITVNEEQALLQALEADRKLEAGEAGPLCGVPIAHKDIFCTQGVRTTCASRMLDQFVPPYDATAVAKLASSGLVSVGKTNMDEFAMGSSTESGFYGSCLNPWSSEHVPGGSSGGSAAAVAAGVVAAATGTDTGGSIRQPAAFCGITGIKPTYGRVSRLGMIAYASSLDQGGVFARSAEDCALILEHMAGHDERDSTSAARPVEAFSDLLDIDLAGLRIGVPTEFFADGLNPDVQSAVRSALSKLETMGATIREISLPRTHLAIPTYYVIAPAEASTNLARYDGVRFGHRCSNPTDLEDLYTRSREEGFGDEVKRRILVGTYVLSSGYYDAYYKKAQQVRRLIADDFALAFKDVDIMAGPTTPDVAFALGEKKDDPTAMYLEDIFTLSASLAGLPAMSIPCGLVRGLPVGLQLIGQHFDEARLLALAHQYQRHTGWHLKRPPRTIDT